MDDIKQQVSQLIIKHRQEKGLTQSDLAKAMGVSRTAVAAYESGKQNLTIDTIAKIESVLGVKIISVIQ